MQISNKSRNTNATRRALWTFEKVDTLRKTIIQRAGRFTRPQGMLTLTISANEWMQKRILNTLDAMQVPA